MVRRKGFFNRNKEGALIGVIIGVALYGLALVTFATGIFASIGDIQNLGDIEDTIGFGTKLMAPQFFFLNFDDVEDDIEDIFRSGEDEEDEFRNLASYIRGIAFWGILFNIIIWFIIGGAIDAVWRPNR